MPWPILDEWQEIHDLRWLDLYEEKGKLVMDKSEPIGPTQKWITPKEFMQGADRNPSYEDLLRRNAELGDYLSKEKFHNEQLQKINEKLKMRSEVRDDLLNTLIELITRRDKRE